MTVNTKNVDERREVHYSSFDDFLSDAERLASGDTRTVGNWTLGQIFQHLSKALDSSIDGTDMKFPWIMRKAFSLLMNKEKMLNNPLRAGYKIPKQGLGQFYPDENISTEDGLEALRESIERCKTETKRSEHLAFGQLTREEWDKFSLRHAEMHMSFAVPA